MRVDPKASLPTFIVCKSCMGLAQLSYTGAEGNLGKLDSELPRDSERLVCYIHRYKNLLIHFPLFFTVLVTEFPS